MMAIQYNPKPDDSNLHRHSITLPNDTAAIPKLHRFLQEVYKDTGLDPSLQKRLTPPLEETVTGLMQNAYPRGTKGTVNIVAGLSGGILSFVISDNGTPEVRPDTGGLRQIMDTVSCERQDKKNVLTLTKDLNNE